MRRLIQRIQSPAALFAFEAAARHLSFSKAGQELNVSQPAISHSIKKIEAALGGKLFHRHHRAVSLTEVGERFYADVSLGLMQIWQSAERIALQTQGRHVTLSVSTAFANYWMVPRLAKFRAMNPHIEIRLQTTDRDIDLAEESVSLAIRRGQGEWADYNAFLLAPERIYPVCSPGFLSRIKRPRRPADLIGCELIHLEEPFRPRPTWSDWFAEQGVKFRDSGHGLRLNDYALVVQAAMAGEGIALGWHHIIELLLQQKLLVPALGQAYAKGAGFYVVWSKSSELSPEAKQVLRWLELQAPG